jgi:hypothetical protein|tara:strand:- start:33 stop:233 length:201 start_codon:yes stop_codon:yes gene_type:complete
VDPLWLTDKVYKLIREKREQLAQIMVSGGVKDMEHYQNLRGQVEVLDYFESEFQNIIGKATEDVDE